jgi:hypothetical protein
VGSLLTLSIFFATSDVLAQTAYDELVHELDPKKAETYAKLGKLPEGHIPVLDDKIVIVQHQGFPQLTTSMGTATRGSGDEIIGDIVNISDETLYFVIIRGNVYKDGALLEHTGSKPEFIYRYDFPDELWSSNYDLANSPHKAMLSPGESSVFRVIPGQVGWDCYEIWIESYLSENKFKGITEERLRQDLELESIRIEKGILKGKLHNPTNNTISLTHVWANKYDENDNMFGTVGFWPGPIEPGKSMPIDMPFYIDADYPIKTHGDRYWDEKPAHYEVSAWGVTWWRAEGWTYEEEEFVTPHKYLQYAKHYPSGDAAYYIDVNDLREKSSERVTSSCLNDPDQVFERGDYRKTIPEWVKNNAGWWAKGKITEDDFLNGIEYLLDNMIIRTDLERQKFKFDINKDKFYFTRHSEDVVVLSGWLEDNKRSESKQKIFCDFWYPGEIYPKDYTIKTTGSPDYKFEQQIFINQNWKEGTYKLDCDHKDTHVFSTSFDVFYGESPEEDEPVVITKVPTWIKKNAEWWANGKITDDEYLESIKFLVTNKIINIPRFVQ